MIPIATTSIAVLRVPVDPERDPTDAAPAASVVASGVRAVISVMAQTSDERTYQGASQEVTRFKLNCDPAEIGHRDQVRDERTNELYEVIWARSIAGINGQDHVEGELRQVQGVAA